MRHTFLRHHPNSAGLLLFFSGWGSEPCMFSNGIEGSAAYDILMLWDYRDMDFDLGILNGYNEVRVLAWSMGVWAAGKALGGADMVNGLRLAVNGTPFPVDDSKGIPTAIFDGTLNGLSERTLAKFRRRMCGSTEALEQLLSCGLTRSVDELREELAAIRETECSAVHETCDTGHFFWSHAIVGARDMIFPSANQKLAWESSDVPSTLKDIPHYDSSLFRQLLYKEDSWTNI